MQESWRATKADGGEAASLATQQLRLSARIVALGLGAGVGLSVRLWYATDRLYPHTPLFAGTAIPSTVELMLLVALLLSLAVVVVHRHRPALWIGITLAATAALVIFDQSRLQPWTYEYALMLTALGFAVGAPDSPRHEWIVTCRLIVVALYFWSGVQKMNVTFLTRTWPDFTGTLASVYPGRTILTHVGWIVPVTEVGIAIGLALRRSRGVAVVAAVTMHAFTTAVLIATNENSVVWPWNVAMAGLVVTLFGRITQDEAILRPVRFGPAIVVAAMVSFLPALSFVGVWDAYLSAALYTGNTIQAVVVVPPDAVERFPRMLARNTWQASPPAFIDINRWSYDELNVPAYPAERVMKAVGGAVCRTYVPPGTGTLVILGRPDWKTGKRDRMSFNCSEFR